MAKFIHWTDSHGESADKIAAIGAFAKGKNIDEFVHKVDFILVRQ